MKEEIYKNISDFTNIEMSEVEMLLEKGITKEFKLQENIIKIGQSNKMVGYLKKGLLRSYFYDDNGNEQTTAFVEQGAFFSELKSYQTKDLSERTIEPIETSEIIIWKIKDIENLRNQIPNLNAFEKKYFEKILKDKVDFQRELIKSSKKEALELLIKKYPQAAKFAPRQYIASFLGMTPYTLSRIK